MPNTTPPDDQFRTGLASNVVIWGSVVISTVAVTIIVFAVVIYSKDRTESLHLVSDIFHSLLPVIAAWIGTVLAFYFGRENFESASRQINNLVNKLTPDAYKEIPVKQVMIDSGTMLKYVHSGDNPVLLSDLTASFNTNADKSRLPIVDSNNNPLFIIHRDEYNSLMQNPANASQPLDKLGSYGLNGTEGFVLIKETSTLNDALNELKAHPKCKDVFITKNGTAAEPLTGWLTDSRILSFLQP